MAIPKIIHYCWLSGEPYPRDIKECIDSWHEHMPDYDFMLWDMNSFDVDAVPYVKQAVATRKWAFASDYIRLWAIYNYGGIYLDSDIKILKRFDDLLSEKAFTAFESGGRIAAWIFGGEKNAPIFKELLDYYKDRPFVREDGSLELIPNTIPTTKILVKHGLRARNELQRLDGITVFTEDYFSPFNPWTKRTVITDNSYAMHLFKGAWFGDKSDEEFMGRFETYTDSFIKEKLSGKRFVIFGAGILGHMVRDYVSGNYPDIIIVAFLVTNNDTGFSDIDGVPICEIGKSRGLDHNLPVFIATVPRYHSEIINALDSAGYKEIFAIGMQDS